MEFPSSKGPLERLRQLKVVKKVLRDDAKDVVREVPPPGGDSGEAEPGLFQRTTKAVVGKLYTQAADDLEDRAVRVAEKAYESSADDLEDRAVRAMRRAVADEMRGAAAASGEMDPTDPRWVLAARTSAQPAPFP